MEVGSPRLPTAKPSRGTLVPGGSPHGLAYGAVTLYGGPFQATSATVGRPPGLEAPAGDPATPHPPTVIPWGIGLGSPPFGRPYSGDPVVVSPPPPTKMFPFGGFPSGTPVPHEEGRFPGRHGLFARGGRSHSAIPGSTAACAYPGLIAACHGLPRRPSRAIHRAASVPQARGRGAEPLPGID